MEIHVYAHENIVLYYLTLEKGLLCVTFFCDNFIFQMIDLPLPDLDPTLLVLIN